MKGWKKESESGTTERQCPGSIDSTIFGRANIRSSKRALMRAALSFESTTAVNQGTERECVFVQRPVARLYVERLKFRRAIGRSTSEV